MIILYLFRLLLNSCQLGGAYLSVDGLVDGEIFLEIFFDLDG